MIESLSQLIHELQKMPSIGPKSAERLAFYFLSLDLKEIQLLTSALIEIKHKIQNCSQCFHITEVNPCSICTDSNRDAGLLCVVTDPRDLMALERTHELKGRYHVLGGLLSPLDGIGPDALRIKELLLRVETNSIHEIIFALPPTVEGETTILYLKRLLDKYKIRLTRLAYGLPVGGQIDYADEMTLTKSVHGRTIVS